MKKLLGAALALTMGVTCTASLAGCDSCGSSKKDADIASRAIAIIRTQYEKFGTEAGKVTDTDYKVLGKVKVDKDYYDVNWTVASATVGVNDVSAYVSLASELNADNTTRNVSITKAETAIDYTLTAAVKVGKAQEQLSYTLTIPAKAKDAAGTENDPYSVAKAIEICQGLPANGYYGGDENPTLVYVTGYLIDFSDRMRQTDTTPDAKRAHWVYIVDEYSEDKTSSDADALCVYSINYDSTNLTCYEDLVKGKKITVKGFLENYKSGSKLQPEVTYKGDVSVECVYLEKVEKTDAEKVAAAKAAVTLESTYTAGEVTLPATSNGASLSWAVTSGTNVTIDGTKMTITEPSADVDVKITVTISSGDVHEDKVIDIKVAKASTKGTLEDPYTAAEAKAIAEGLTAGAYLTENGNPKQVYVQGYITVLGSWDATNKRYGNSYIADDASASQANSLLVWSISAKDGSALENDGDIAQGDLVVLSGFIQNHSKSGAEISYSGSDNVNIVSKGPDNRTPEEKAQAALDKFTLADGATVTGNITVPEGVTISSDNTAVIDNTGKVNRPAEADGNATVTLTVSATVDGATKTKTVTVTVKALSTAVGQSASLAFSTATNTKNAADQMIFAKDGMTVTFDKGTATVDANNGNYLGADGNAAQLRAYQGGIVTIAFNGINKIVFTVDTYKNTYPTDLEATIKAAYPDATVTIDGVKVTVEFASAENEISFTMTKQVRMKSIDINPAD